MRPRGRDDGQGIVEFALVLPILLVLLIALFDVGRGIYLYNGVAEAAREIARTTSVHPGTTLGGSAETAATLATQRRLIPGLNATAWNASSQPTGLRFECVDIAGATASHACEPGDWVRVTVHASYVPATPLLGLLGVSTFDLHSTSSVEIQ